MRRLGAALAAASVLALVPSAGLADGTTLTGTVGPGFSISLTDPSGALVRHLDPGAYTVHVHDESEVHNFHLVGPGVDQATVVETEGDFTWPVTLAAGTYRFFCDVHPGLNGSFTVGDQPPPPPPPPPPVRALKLVGRVGPGARIALTTPGGAPARRTAAGVYLITVRDLSAKDNFHLTGPGVSRRTGVAQRKTLTWKVTLEPGTYRYRSDAHPRLKGSLTVTSPA